MHVGVENALFLLYQMPEIGPAHLAHTTMDRKQEQNEPQLYCPIDLRQPDAMRAS